MDCGHAIPLLAPEQEAREITIWVDEVVAARQAQNLERSHCISTWACNTTLQILQLLHPIQMELFPWQTP